mmetsp:Transcript_37704/g.43063  ORF Transcript_37704/g.43063 Transcript_37704/m.43063 type:complete len:81 (+) Transcript_37704:102-344(+)
MLPFAKSTSSGSLSALVKNLSSGNLSAMANEAPKTQALKPQAPKPAPHVPVNSLLPFGRHLPVETLQKLNDASKFVPTKK